jgi:hypothetical protein
MPERSERLIPLPGFIQIKINIVELLGMKIAAAGVARTAGCLSDSV